MQAILSPREKITEYFERYEAGEMTWQEFQRVERRIMDTCPHNRILTHTDENDNYVWCQDCGDDL